MNKTTLFETTPGSTQSYHIEKIRNCFSYVEKLSRPICCGVCNKYPYPATNGVLHDDLACERILCKTCITDTCPFCTKLMGDVARVPRYAMNIYNSVQVKCNECDEEMEREFYENHYWEDCLIICEFCHIAFNRVDLSVHSCPEEMINCGSDGCSLSFKRKDLEEHLDECRYYILEGLGNYDCKIKFLVNTSELLFQRVAAAEEHISSLVDQIPRKCKNCGKDFSFGDGSVCRYHPVFLWINAISN
eukprot:TRINITY_DN644_c0_g1_i13.p1 TRINITY_DN644_c0_g1~~TRINITY_DN644_c0_g1_i13.p1  ORF type:complete len:246 (-),score=24.10 TRINITY_DN644_c0_g1_i13:465-1202(-)